MSTFDVSKHFLATQNEEMKVTKSYPNVLFCSLLQTQHLLQSSIRIELLINFIICTTVNAYS